MQHTRGEHAQVSMVDGDLLDTLEAAARHVRRSDKPFGGIQLVLSGARPACSSACPDRAWQRPARHATQCMLRLVWQQRQAWMQGSIMSDSYQQEEIMVHDSPFGRAQCV